VKGPTPSRTLAAEEVSTAAGVRYEALLEEHTAWWHRFWPKSFVSLPDRTLEGFYNIQLYKLGSATRCSGPDNCWPYDLHGPWWTPDHWQGYTWDLNVQMAHWPVLASNHLELGASLVAMVNRNQNNLAANALAVDPKHTDGSVLLPGKASFDMNNLLGASALPLNSSRAFTGGVAINGDLTWVLHNIWLQHRYGTDHTVLNETLAPVLRRA
jgi:hypothetical protein